MKPAEHHILLALAEHAHPDGTSAYPSRARLALMTGYSPRSITRILADLIAAGMIEVEVEDGWLLNGKTMPTSYRMPLFRRVDKMATPPAPGVDKMTSQGWTSSTGGVDKMSTEPRTEPTTENQEQKEASGKPSPDPESSLASKITKDWWDAFSPKPTGGFMGQRQLVLSAVKAGFSEQEIRAALATFKEPVFNRRAMEQALRKGQSGVGGYEGRRNEVGGIKSLDEFFGTEPSEGA